MNIEGGLYFTKITCTGILSGVVDEMSS
jgi:hypothetical protein